MNKKAFDFTKDLVSVIVPNYNGEKYIEKCIRSIIEQTYRNIEIIVVDDGSTDNSLDVIKKMKEEDERIQFISQANMNASIARNRGIEISKGEYLYFIDSDDIMYEKALELMVCAIKENQCDLVLGQFGYINGNDEMYQRYRFTRFNQVDEPLELCGQMPVPANKLYRKDIVVQNNISFANVRIGQDSNFYLKYLLKCRKAYILDEMVFGYRILEGSISRSYSHKIFDIIDEFNDVKRFYISHDALKQYDYYIKMVEYVNCYFQMCKQKYFESKEMRKLVILFFRKHLKEMRVKDCYLFSENRKIYIKCRMRIIFPWVYYSEIFKVMYGLKCKYKKGF